MWVGGRICPPFPCVSYDATKRVSRWQRVTYRDAGPKRCHHSQTSRVQFHSLSFLPLRAQKLGAFIIINLMVRDSLFCCWCKLKQHGKQQQFEADFQSIRHYWLQYFFLCDLFAWNPLHWNFVQLLFQDFSYLSISFIICAVNLINFIFISCNSF